MDSHCSSSSSDLMHVQKNGEKDYHCSIQYIDDLQQFLNTHAPGSLIIPAAPTSDKNASDAGKRPFKKHKNGAYTIEDFHLHKHKCLVHGALIILSSQLIVVDVDDRDWADAFISEIPEFNLTVSTFTAKGIHFYFLATDASRSAGMTDGSRQMWASDNALPIDIKTTSRSGAGGLISIPPSVNKHWRVPPIQNHILPMPESFVQKYLQHRKQNNNGRRKLDESPPPPPLISQSQLQEINALVNILDHYRRDDYNEWIRVGLCLHSIEPSERLLRVWDAFSSSSPKYSPGITLQKWNSFSSSSASAAAAAAASEDFPILTLASLHAWAKHDNPDAYARLTVASLNAIDFSIPAFRKDNKTSSFNNCTSNNNNNNTSELERSAVVKRLIDQWPEKFSQKISINSFKMVHDVIAGGVPVFRFHDTLSGIKGTIFPDYSVHVDGKTQGESWKLMGELSPGICVKELGRLHKDIHHHTTFNYSRDSETDTALLKGTGQQDSASITILGPFSGDPRVRVKIDGRHSRVTKKDTEWLMDTIVTRAQQHAALHHGLALFQLNFHGNTTIINTTMNNDAGDFQIIRMKLLDYATKFRLRKKDGFVFKPVDGCPCAYVVHANYPDFINDVLMDDEIYFRNPKRFDEALKYLTNYKDRQLPSLVVDRDLISFSNGVLHLESLDFTEYSSMMQFPEQHQELFNRVARHHINHIYTGSTITPVLDEVLDYQFDHSIAELLCALFGRALFKVGQRDKWQVMPYIFGLAGTGKSLLLKVLTAMFADGVVGSLASKREEVFGMANIVDKEIVIGADMPQKLSGVLSQETMQAMTAGDNMEIPRKGTTALSVTWTAPVVLASNHMPDYTNTGNNIGRRLVTFKFEKPVLAPREDLQDILTSTELPNIICRCLHAYNNLISKVKCTKQGGFWGAVPDAILQWQHQLAAATNKLHHFLDMDEDERGCSIQCVDGHVTWELDFKAAFEAFYGKGSYTPDVAVFQRFGFRKSSEPENACKSCKQIAKSRGGKCCEQYSNNNRTKKHVIFNMKLTKILQDDASAAPSLFSF